MEQDEHILKRIWGFFSSYNLGKFIIRRQRFDEHRLWYFLEILLWELGTKEKGNVEGVNSFGTSHVKKSVYLQ